MDKSALVELTHTRIQRLLIHVALNDLYEGQRNNMLALAAAQLYSVPIGFQTDSSNETAIRLQAGRLLVDKGRLTPLSDQDARAVLLRELSNFAVSETKYGIAKLPSETEICEDPLNARVPDTFNECLPSAVKVIAQAAALDGGGVWIYIERLPIEIAAACYRPVSKFIEMARKSPHKDCLKAYTRVARRLGELLIKPANQV